MTDIQRYSLCESCGSTQVARERRPNGNDRCMKCLNEWPSKETKILIPEQDHIKAIQEEKNYSSGLEGIVKEQTKEIAAQAKEIERLKTELKKAQSKQADDDCKLCNWTCQKCGKYVEPENVLFDETHEGCGGICL